MSASHDTFLSIVNYLKKNWIDREFINAFYHLIINYDVCLKFGNAAFGVRRYIVWGASILKKKKGPCEHASC